MKIAIQDWSKVKSHPVQRLQRKIICFEEVHSNVKAQILNPFRRLPTPNVLWRTEQLIVGRTVPTVSSQIKTFPREKLRLNFVNCPSQSAFLHDSPHCSTITRDRI